MFNDEVSRVRQSLSLEVGNLHWFAFCVETDCRQLTGKYVDVFQIFMKISCTVELSESSGFRLFIVRFMY